MHCPVPYDGAFALSSAYVSDVVAIPAHSKFVLIDPAPLFGLVPQHKHTKHALVLRYPSMAQPVALLVAGVEQVVLRSSLEPADSSVRPYVSWVAMCRQRLIYIVNLKMILKKMLQQN